MSEALHFAGNKKDQESLTSRPLAKGETFLTVRWAFKQL